MEVLDSNELYKEYGEFIHRLAISTHRKYSWGLDVGEAEQIAWEAAMRCYSRYRVAEEDAESPAKFEAYAYHRIKGAIIDEVRKRTRHRSIVDGEKILKPKIEEHLEDMSASQYEETLKYHIDPEEFLSPSFDEIVKPLRNERYKDILRMIYVYDKSITEIAARYGISGSRVEQIRNKGLKHLQRHREVYNA